MITKDLKISKLLAQYPQTINVLINVSSHFKKLKNPILRKALAGRVNIEQAAGIANVDVNNLLSKLNNSINNIPDETNFVNHIDVKTDAGDDKMQRNSFEIDQNKVVQFDVRPIISGGNDPLKLILAKIKELNNDEILLLINSFEPIPLYTVLGRQGYAHKVEKEDDVFKIYFYKDSTLNAAEGKPVTHNNDDINIADFENITEIDVRGLEPPEPMIKVLETISNLNNNTALLVHHHREPMMLYPKLEERGFQHFCTKINDEYFKIVIVKKKG